jgi:YhcH/YjgK/YiaL family protein
MIVDRLENLAVYLPLGGRLARALRLLQTRDFSGLACGRHPLEGDDIFALVNEYPLKPRAEGRLEAHRKHIDIQYLLCGGETMGYAPLQEQPPLAAYDAAADLIFYAGDASMLSVEQGMFAIFYPGDLHMPGLGSPAARVRKVVLKVRI